MAKVFTFILYLRKTIGYSVKSTLVKAFLPSVFQHHHRRMSSYCCRRRRLGAITKKQLHLEFARLLQRTSQLKWNCRMSEDELVSLAALQLQLAATRASPATSPPNPRPTKSQQRESKSLTRGPLSLSAVVCSRRGPTGCKRCLERTRGGYMVVRARLNVGWGWDLK